MRFRALVLVLSALALSAPASAVTFGFHCITNNSASNCAIGEAQMTVELLNNGNLVFRNVGSADSSITYLAWEGDAFIFGGEVTPPGSVVMNGLNGAVLPGGDALSPPFTPSDGAVADSIAHGINPGETQVIFMLPFPNTSAGFIQGVLDGTFRIGIEVQGFAGGGSESFINNITPIPEPGSAALVAAGLVMLARRRRHA
jgi:hypothetical protein